MDKITYPKLCDCGEKAHHHFFTDDEKRIYKSLCDGCMGRYLANKSVDETIQPLPKERT